MSGRVPGELVEVGDGVFAWVRASGSWGWSNSGLVTGAGADGAALVDTQFDLAATAEMLDAMRAAVPAAARLDVVVNTHANGDHTYGNELTGAGRILATEACAATFAETTPETMAGFLAMAPDLGELGEFVAQAFGSFDFSGITLTPPTETFTGERRLAVGDRGVDVIELGPAHTAGDAVAWVPDAGVLFTGDLVFSGGFPIVWAGPVQHWIDSCRRMEALAPSVVVPGHGPIGDASLLRDEREHLEWLVAEVAPRAAAEMAPLEAARDIGTGPYGGWADAERMAVNVVAVYRDLGHEVTDDVVTLFTQMAALAADRHP